MSIDLTKPGAVDALMKKKVDPAIERRQKAMAMAIYQKLIEATPVDTGRARSNWWMDTAPSVTIIEPDDTSSGMAQAASMMGRNIELGSTIYISNNLPYIQRLDDGYSGQAPAGMTAQAIQYGEHRAKEYERGLK